MTVAALPRGAAQARAHVCAPSLADEGKAEAWCSFCGVPIRRTGAGRWSKVEQPVASGQMELF